MKSLTRKQKWSQSITDADFEEIVSEFIKGNPAAIEIVRLMHDKNIFDYCHYIDLIQMQKRINDYIFFEGMAPQYNQLLAMNNSAAVEALKVFKYMAKCGHVPAMYSCGEHYRCLAIATEKAKYVDSAIYWHQRAAEAGYSKSIKKLRYIRKLFYTAFPRVRRLPTYKELDACIAKTESFEAMTKEYFILIPTLAAIIR